MNSGSLIPEVLASSLLEKLKTEFSENLADLDRDEVLRKLVEYSVDCKALSEDWQMRVLVFKQVLAELNLSPVRTRFAPSPTGYLHIGGARTALFNWLFARHYGGEFILRIEDTDLQRSKPEYETSILSDLEWLGLHWDELHKQSQRFEIYREFAQKLLDSGHAYRCFCTKEELEEMRRRQAEEGKKIGYDRRCRYLTEEQVQEKLRQGLPYSIRFKVPMGLQLEFEDGIAGRLTLSSDELEDFVILKSDGTPTYNFAVVIDDNMMNITHVLRGQEHTINTFKQLLIYKAFGWKPPKFYHLSIILDEQRKKLSKRKGSVFVRQFRDEGYLPEALFNFLALLGWSPKDNREIISKSDLINQFSERGFSNSPAVFDYRKLLWMNSQYLQNLTEDELITKLEPYLEARGYNLALITPQQLRTLAGEYRTRAKTLAQLAGEVDYVFLEPAPDPQLLAKYMSKLKPLELWEEVLETLENTSFDSPESIKASVESFLERYQLKLKNVAQGLRVAVTGKTQSCGIFHTLFIVGKERTVKRLRTALEHLKAVQ